MSEPTKRKKPPSCDHCKAKRVLCHPSPQGCPRCLEKRIPCTTTPVVRRKPTRKTQHTDGRSHESSVEATAAGSSSGAASTPVPVAQQAATPAAPPTFPHLLSANPGASAPQLAAVSSAGAAPLPPAAPFAVPLYNPMGGSSASPMPTSDPTVLPSTLVASTSQVPYTANPAQASTAALASNAPSLRRPDLVQPSPAFARHLFDCFRNTSLYDHPISRGSRLQELLEPVGYRLELLDPQARTMAYASFALGALMSFDPAIIGTDGPGASSFNEMELVCGQLGDLRQFGRRRVSACGVMREHALKMAKDTDVLLEPTRNNAASALILDFLTNLSDARSPNRPWLAAFMGHVRVLCDTGELNIVDGAQTVWGLHLGSDMFTELSSGRLTANAADQLALVGDLDVDLDAFEKKLRSWLPVPQLHDVFRETLHPFALAQLAISRELADNILAVHARRAPFDEAAVAQFLAHLQHFRTVAALNLELIDKVLESDERLLFPHATQRRVRYTTQMALLGIRTFVAMSSSVCVMPLFRELRRRLAEAQDAQRRAESTVEKADKEALVERVELLVRQFSRVVLGALKTLIEALDRSPYILLTATLRKVGIVEWGVVFLHEIEQGAIPLDDTVADLLEKVAELAKIAGYSHWSANVDVLIACIEAHVAAYRSAGQRPQPQPPHAHAALSAEAANDTPFEFAFLSELSNSAGTSPENAAAAAAAGAAPTAAAAAAPGGLPGLSAANPSLVAGLGVFDTGSDGGATPGGGGAGAGGLQMPTFSPEQLAQLLGAAPGAEGMGMDVGMDVQGEFAGAADVFAGWGAW